MKAENEAQTKEAEEIKKQKSQPSTSENTKTIKPVEAQKQTPKVSTATLSNSQIIKKVKPAVVYIESDAGTGSGMIIGSDGFVLTNAHVVQNSATAQITLSSGSVYLASVVGRDENIDLAILKINAQNLLKIEFGDSNTIKQGDEVFTLGYPFGIKGDVSFKEGTISRKIVDGVNSYLETSAEIHPGNSGGPLVDASGNVVGVNSASFGQSIKGIAVGETIKFAIPINVAKNLIPELKAGRQVIVPKTETPVAGDPFQTEDSNLKIARCQAAKQSSYDAGILTFDQKVKDELQKISESLNIQYQKAVNDFRNNAATKKLEVDNLTVSEFYKWSLRRQYDDEAIIKAQKLYSSQQTLLKNQKYALEDSKQEFINKINVLLSTEYLNCIN